MNYIDIILGIVLAWGAIQGFRKGLFVSLASFIAIIVGIYAAIHFSEIVEIYLKAYVSWSRNVIQLTAFVITFIIIIILVTLSGKLLTKIADFASLGTLNTFLGALFGLLKMGSIVCILVFCMDTIQNIVALIPNETLQNSVVYTSIQYINTAWIPEIWKRFVS